MSKIKQGLLVGTVLSTLVLTSVHAAPLEGVLVIAQALKQINKPRRRKSLRSNHKSVRYNRHRRSSVKCSRPHRARSLYQFHSSSKVNAAAKPPRCNRRVRLHRSSRSDSPRWHRPRFNCRLRRPDLRRHRSNGPSCHRRLRIMRGILMMSAEPVARCAKATVS